MVGPYPTSKNYRTLDTFCYSYFIDKNIFEPPSWNSEITLNIILSYKALDYSLDGDRLAGHCTAMLGGSVEPSCLGLLLCGTSALIGSSVLFIFDTIIAGR